MAAVVIDDTAANIVIDIIQTLRDASVGGLPAFDDVQETRSELDFLTASNMLSGAEAGVIVSRPQREYGTDNSQEFQALLKLEVVVKTFFKIGPGGDETGGIEALDLLVDVVRSSLRQDPLRNGLARRIMWKGKIIDGTSVDGEPRTLKLAKNQPTNTFGAAVPIAVAWTKELVSP